MLVCYGSLSFFGGRRKEPRVLLKLKHYAEKGAESKTESVMSVPTGVSLHMKNTEPGLDEEFPLQKRVVSTTNLACWCKNEPRSRRDVHADSSRARQGHHRQKPIATRKLKCCFLMNLALLVGTRVPQLCNFCILNMNSMSSNMNPLRSRQLNEMTFNYIIKIVTHNIQFNFLKQNDL